jgi:hypothetical protein
MAEKAKLEVTPVSGENIDALMKELYATPPEVAKKAAAAVK